MSRELDKRRVAELTPHGQGARGPERGDPAKGEAQRSGRGATPTAGERSGVAAPLTAGERGFFGAVQRHGSEAQRPSPLGPQPGRREAAERGERGVESAQPIDGTTSERAVDGEVRTIRQQIDLAPIAASLGESDDQQTDLANEPNGNLSQSDQSGDGAPIKLPPAPTPIPVSGQTMPLSYNTDYSLSTTELGQRIKPQKRYRHGHFSFNPYLAVTLDIAEKVDPKTNRPVGCYARSVQVWFGVQNATLYVAKDYKPGTSAWFATVEHELKHAMDTERVSKEHADAAKQRVNGADILASEKDPDTSVTNSQTYHDARLPRLSQMLSKPFSKDLGAAMAKLDKDKCEYANTFAKSKEFKHGDHEAGVKLKKKNHCE